MKPMAALQTNQPQLSKRLKRKLGDDDRLRAVIEKILDDTSPSARLYLQGLALGCRFRSQCQRCHCPEDSGQGQGKGN